MVSPPAISVARGTDSAVELTPNMTVDETDGCGELAAWIFESVPEDLGVLIAPRVGFDR